MRMNKAESSPTREARTPKRGDVLAEQVKRWITERNLHPGDKLPKEAELQTLFGVGKGTVREALKSLEVQGLVTIGTGPNGGATVAEVRFGRTFQFVQNYLFFEDMTVADIYALRRVVEPELAATSVLHLTLADIDALEQSIAFCTPSTRSPEVTQMQREEDLNFHEILARANPNPLLRMVAQVINELLRHIVKLGGRTDHKDYRRFGHANLKAHKEIMDAIRRRDADAVRRLMLEHILEAEEHVQVLQGVVEQKLLLDSELGLRIAPSRARSGKARPS